MKNLTDASYTEVGPTGFLFPPISYSNSSGIPR